MNIDIVKLNHWLNARKISSLLISGFSKKLASKIEKAKDFSASESEIRYLTKSLNIPREDIKIQEKIPKYIHWNNKKFNPLKERFIEIKSISIITIHYHLQKVLYLQ